MNLNLQFFSSSGGVKIIFSEFYINGHTAAAGQRSLAVSQYGFDASTWDSAGRLTIFPESDAINPTPSKAGDVHSLAIFDQVL